MPLPDGMLPEGQKAERVAGWVFEGSPRGLGLGPRDEVAVGLLAEEPAPRVGVEVHLAFSKNAFSKNAFFENFANFWRARSRLYQNEILQQKSTKYAFDSIFQALQDLHPFAPLQSQNFSKKSV